MFIYNLIILRNLIIYAMNHALKATEEKNSSYINPIVYPSSMSPTESFNMISTDKSWIKPEVIATD